MINTIILGAVGGGVLFAVIYLAIAEGRRRARAEAEAEHAEEALEARGAMDEAMRRKVGKRWKLVAWARKRLSS